jgi:hypothetical protein
VRHLRTNKGRFLLPSIADILFLSLFLTLSLSVSRILLTDGDTGYHIRTGEFILDTFSVPRHDIFSFLSPPPPWIAHEWLSEVIMALAHKSFGLTGVVVFFSFVIATAYYLLFKVIKTKGNIVLSVLVILLVLAASQLHWLARPHIFSLLLLVVWYSLLDAYQYNDKNYLYFLIPIMLLWVNLHGGFMSGFILMGVYLLGNLVGIGISQTTERKRCKEKVMALGLTTVACLLVSLINPYGYHILLFPFRLISDKFLMDHVVEFISPNFHDLMPFRYLLFLTIAILAVSKARLNVIELILIILFIHMALYSARYITLFAIIAAPILVKQAELILKTMSGRFIDFFNTRTNNIAAIDASSKCHLWPMVGVAAVCIFAANGTIEYKFDERAKPVAAIEFLKVENLRGNMLNNDEFGDYLIYAAWPKYRVFFDGRSDMYGASRMKEYFKVAGVKQGWEDVIEKYNINWIIYNANSPLSMFLMERKDWRLIYADKVANIFVRNIPENQAIITKYPDVKLVVKE